MACYPGQSRPAAAVALREESRVCGCMLQCKGGSTAGEKGEKLFEELAKLWPPGCVTGEGIRKVRV